MNHLPSLITDLGIILILGSIFSLLCKILKQPVVLGYIIAGFISGPHFLFKTINPANISTWADIGMIFLLFGMGLEFSFKKMISIGKVGGKAMLFEAISLSIVGFIVGKMIGWQTGDSILLGCMLIMSSTAIIFKAFSDLGLSKEKFSNIVFGILIFEDLFAILLMVVISTLAVSKQFEGKELFFVVMKLIFFLVIWIVCGIYLIPTFLKKAKKYLNEETLLLISMGLCFSMVVFATSVGFSSALGAFIMGSLLAETLEKERIEKVITPIKDFFGAIFFVSVGMMVNPKILADNFTIVIIIAMASIFGKMIFSTLGVRLTGQTLKTSMQCGFSLAQMGEFSFIVASVGMKLGIISEKVYPIVIAVSVLTTFTTPYTIRLALPTYNVIEAIVPKSWQRLLYPKNKNKTIRPSSLWRQFLSSYFSYLIIFIIICIAILMISFTLGVKFTRLGENHLLRKIIATIVTLGVLAPIIRAMIHNMGKQAYLFLSLWSNDMNNRFILSFLIAFRYLIAFLIIFLVIHRYFFLPSYVIVLIAIIFFAFVFHSKILLKSYWAMESRFVKNFNARQIVQQRNLNTNNDNKQFNELDNLHWIDRNMYVATLTIKENSEINNKTLKDMNFRKSYNVIILAIKRDGIQYNFPDGDFILKDNDILLTISSITMLRKMDLDYESLTMDFNEVKTLNEFNIEQQKNKKSQINCLTFIIEKGSFWIGNSLIDSSLMKEAKCMVIGIERDDTPIVNPSSHVVFQENDMVWAMGDKKTLYKLLEKNYFDKI